MISQPDVTREINKKKPEPGMQAEDWLDANLSHLLGYTAV